MEVYVEYDEEGELFDVMPKLFPFRKPSFQIFSPLPNDVAGLTLLTQDAELFKKLNSVRTPLKRVYEVQVQQDYTGLENEALQLFRGDIKPSLRNLIPEPRFNVVDERNRIAHIVLYDYRPDRILDMLISMRHDPVSIKRIGLGNLILATDTTMALFERIKRSQGEGPEVEEMEKRMLRLGDADWMELDEERLAILTRPQQDIIDKRREIKMTRRSAPDSKPLLTPAMVAKNILHADRKFDLDKMRIPTRRVGNRRKIGQVVEIMNEAMEGLDNVLGAVFGDGKKEGDASKAELQNIPGAVQQEEEDFVVSKKKLDKVFERYNRHPSERSGAEVGGDTEEPLDLTQIGRKLRIVTAGDNSNNEKME